MTPIDNALTSNSLPSDAPRTWRGLGKFGWMTLVALLLGAGILVFPRVVWGPCLDDPGELQVCAAVGGIGHPPGHAGIVTILRLICTISPVYPHLTVSGVNACFALAVVGILIVLMLRTGVSPLAASIAAILFLIDDQFWHLAITPEVYGTCVFLLMAGAWSFLSWLHDRRVWKFWLSVILFALVVTNRAPTATFSVAFLGTLLGDERGRAFLRRGLGWKTAGVIAIFAAAGGLVFVSIWVRDVPGNPYNYLDRSYPAMHQAYPEHNVTAQDKWDRLWWLVSARQYNYMFHPDVRTLSGQSLWLITELGWRYWRVLWPIIIAVGAIFVIGAVELWRTNRAAATFVFLMIPAAAVPILLIRVVSNTAVLPNLMFPLAWLFGSGLTWVLRSGRAYLTAPCVVGIVSLTIWMTADASLLRREDHFDANPFIRQVDLASLPKSAVLITSFDAVALVYAQEIFAVRPDILILNHHGRMNLPFWKSLNRPIYTTEALPEELSGLAVGEGLVREIRLPRNE